MIDDRVCLLADDGTPVDDLGPAHGRVLGLALAVGTTTVVLELVDLGSGEAIAAAAFENPQRFGGSDVMSRIAYEASQPGELRRALATGRAGRRHAAGPAVRRRCAAAGRPSAGKCR